MLSTEGAQLSHVERLVGRHKCRDNLSLFLIWQADNCYLGHVRVGHKHCFDLGWKMIFTTTNDNVFHTACHPNKLLGVYSAQVSGMQPSVAIDRGGSGWPAVSTICSSVASIGLRKIIGLSPV